MKKRKKILFMLLAVAFVLLICGSYMTWNRLDPQYTCAQCHEISPSHARWTTSAHAEVSCVECHGTAISNGFHSLSEKIGMVITHITGNKHNDDISLSEDQVLRISEQCARCHQSEYKGWLASGHAVNYNDIFMDSVHNAMEKPYWDCYRCHGMFYEGNIHDMMDLEGNDPSKWKMRDTKQGLRSTIPCLACHQIHTDNPVSIRYISMADSTRSTIERNPKTALYMRSEKMYMRSDKLIGVRMFDGDNEVKSASDPATLLCQQCHAPNYLHHVGSQDDRTVTGVHEGMSCIACHKPHSGETKESCNTCHPNLTDEQRVAVFKNPHSYKIPMEEVSLAKNTDKSGIKTTK